MYFSFENSCAIIWNEKNLKLKVGRYAMPKITIHNDSDSSVTSVSNIFIDEYMSRANGEFVKIYLYLLRLMNAPDTAVSLSSIADKFEHTEKDVKRALCYWERMRLLRLEYDEEQNLTGVHLLGSAAKTGEASQPEAAAAVPAQKAFPSGTEEELSLPEPSGETDSVPEAERLTESAAVLPQKKCYTADDIKAFREKEQIQELIFIAERYLRRTLNQTDTDTLLYLYDGLGFSADLIEYLIEYCVSGGHVAIRYIESVALKWAESGVHSVMDAKQISQLHGQAYFAVKRAFGISGRDLVSSETACIEKWRKDYGFSLEIITAACDYTIRATQKPSFAYADSILSTWKKMQVHSMADVEKLMKEHRENRSDKNLSSSGETGSKNKFNNFKQRSYDYDQLEKMLLTTNVQ